MRLPSVLKIWYSLKYILTLLVWKGTELTRKIKDKSEPLKCELYHKNIERTVDIRSKTDGRRPVVLNAYEQRVKAFFC